MPSETALQEALGQSAAFMEFQRRLGRVARVDRPVLVIGERGTGKELAASRLHFLSPRWNAPFVALNCSALPQGLIESELFGHEAGAFTGALGAVKGRFEEADGGTLFLDEIGLIPVEVQEKILRTVEYGTFQRVGSSRNHEVNVRIIGATNQDLRALTDKGRFKRDLLDRLSFEVLFLPPLRERGDDLLLLAGHFASRMARELNIEAVPSFSEEVKAQILGYAWPGNIRELKNAVERAVYREDGNVIRELDLDPFRNPWSPVENAPPAAEPDPGWPRDIKKALFDLEQRWLEDALARADGHQGKAAKLLGLSYDQLRGLYRKHGGE
jgi:psp operon transcriptional activator